MIHSKPKHFVLSLRHRSILKILLAATLWGLSGTAAQVLFHNSHLSTLWVLAIRTEFGGGLLLLYLLVTKGTSELLKIVRQPKVLVGVVLYGVLALGGVQLTYFLAISHGNAVSATLLQYGSPVILFAWSVATTKRRSARYLLESSATLLLALAGTLAVLTNGSFSAFAIPISGIVWGLIAAGVAALYMKAPTKLLKDYDSAYIVAIGLTSAGVVFSPFWFLSAPVHAPSLAVIGMLTFIIIAGTSISFTLFINSLKTLPPFEASVVSCAEPVAAGAANVLFLGFPLHFIAVVGGAVTMTSVVFISSRQNRQQLEPDRDLL